MQIKTITYRRTKNLGNYQSETVEATAELNEGENPYVVFDCLKTYVLEFLKIKSEDEF